MSSQVFLFFFFGQTFLISHPVYANSLLANLNARKMIRDSSENTTGEKLGVSLHDMSKASTNVGFTLVRICLVDFSEILSLAAWN